jgi:hypothetical protein
LLRPPLYDLQTDIRLAQREVSQASARRAATGEFMRKSDLRKNHDPFDTALARYRSFAEKVIKAQRVISTAEEKRDLAESTLLRLVANWESFLNEHLVDCINRDPTILSTFFGVTVPRNPSKDLCHALIFGERYRDFRTFGELTHFSGKLLPQPSNPFIAVTRAHRDGLDEAYKIRNYLSHYSARSRRVLMAMYRRQYGMDRFLEPGQFLLAYNARRLWRYFSAFEGASADMKAWY